VIAEDLAAQAEVRGGDQAALGEDVLFRLGHLGGFAGDEFDAAGGAAGVAAAGVSLLISRGIHGSHSLESAAVQSEPPNRTVVLWLSIKESNSLPHASLSARERGVGSDSARPPIRSQKNQAPERAEVLPRWLQRPR
jgi:hypothetical protein